jgi:ABC-type sugar transport system substrate-binding protein
MSLEGVTAGTRRKLLLLVGMLIAALALTACGSSSSSSSSSEPAASESGSEESEAASSEEAESGSEESESGSEAGESVAGKKVALVACGDVNPWCKVYNATIIEGLEKEGVEVQYLQDPFEPTLQVQHLESAIGQHPDAVLVVASNDDSIVPSLTQAKSAGVPVINLNGRPAEAAEPLLASSIEANQEQLGQYAAENIIEGLEEEGLTSGNIMAITGTAATHTTEDRMKAFKEVLAEHPQFKLVEEQDGNWEPILTAKLASQIFAKYQNQGGIQGAYGMADYQANAIIQAAEQAGVPVGVANKGLIVSGSNCFKEGIENIEAGKQYGTATQAPGAEGEFVVPLVIEMLEGKEIPKDNKKQESRINPKDVKKYKAQCSLA